MKTFKKKLFFFFNNPTKEKPEGVVVGFYLGAQWAPIEVPGHLQTTEERILKLILSGCVTLAPNLDTHNWVMDFEAKISDEQWVRWTQYHSVI